MKLLFTAAALALMAGSASAASVERVGAKVAGESTWITAIRFDSGNGAVTITTEDMAKGRAIEGAEVVPAGTFNPASMRSAVAYIQARYGVTPDTYAGGSSNGFVTHPNGTRGPGNRDRDNF